CQRNDTHGLDFNSELDSPKQREQTYLRENSNEILHRRHLWNVSYDGVLRKSYPEGVEAVAFADDSALIVRANSEYELKHKAEIAIEIVENWMEENSLTLAKHKTETVVLKGPRNKDNIVIRTGETSLQPVKHLKYLGITLSENGDYREHIRRTAKNTEERIATLSRITPNISGPSSQKRSMLHGVVKSVILYGAQLWHPVLEKADLKRQSKEGKSMRTCRILAKELVTRRPKIKISTELPCRAPTRPAFMPRQASFPISIPRWHSLPPLPTSPPHTTPATPLSLPELQRLPPPPVTTQPPGDNTWSTDRLIQSYSPSIFPPKHPQLYFFSNGLHFRDGFSDTAEDEVTAGLLEAMRDADDGPTTSTSVATDIAVTNNPTPSTAETVSDPPDMDTSSTRSESSIYQYVLEHPEESPYNAAFWTDDAMDRRQALAAQQTTDKPKWKRDPPHQYSCP
ncbi:hypothetical protein JTB14_009373, partial [Gonioctena quinquepunctata]